MANVLLLEYHFHHYLPSITITSSDRYKYTLDFKDQLLARYLINLNKTNS
jgi:hypothetical protein